MAYTACLENRHTSKGYRIPLPPPSPHIVQFIPESVRTLPHYSPELPQSAPIRGIGRAVWHGVGEVEPRFGPCFPPIQKPYQHCLKLTFRRGKP